MLNWIAARAYHNCSFVSSDGQKGIYKVFCDAISASEVIVRSDVPPLIKPAWQNAFAPENIKGGF